jgi:predicted phosphodiesterase
MTWTAAESFPEKRFVLVKGNCDFASAYPELSIEHIGGKVLYCTHGTEKM